MFFCDRRCLDVRFRTRPFYVAVGAATLYTWLSDDATEQRSLTYAALRRQATVARRSSARFR